MKSISTALKRVMLIVSFMTPRFALSPTLVTSNVWRCRWTGWLSPLLLVKCKRDACAPKGAAKNSFMAKCERESKADGFLPPRNTRTCPKLPAHRTYRGHCGNGADDF